MMFPRELWMHFHNHLQNFEVDLSTVRYGKIFSLPRLGYFRLLVEKIFRFVFVAKFRVFFAKFRENFAKIRKFSKNKNFRASKIFKPRQNFCTVSFHINFFEVEMIWFNGWSKFCRCLGFTKMALVSSVTRKKLQIVYKSCQK